MLFFEETINIIKLFNSTYVYPMDYTIFDTHDTDPNDQKDYGQIINFKFLRDESVSATLTLYFYLVGSTTPIVRTISDTSDDKTFTFSASVKRIRLVYLGLTEANKCKIVELNCSFGELLSDKPMCEDVVFVPYQNNIQSCMIQKTNYTITNTRGCANVVLYITDNFEETTIVNNINIYSDNRFAIIDNWGEINLYTPGILKDFPQIVLIELPVIQRLDNYYYLHNNQNS